MDKNLAHETLKSFIENTNNVIVRDAILVLHPELNENEDEKIRTRLIALVEAFGQGKYKDEMLSYLERQKEQQPAEQLDGTFTSYDMAKTFMEGQNYVIAHTEKFGLCKPAEWSEEDKEIMDSLIKYHYDQGEISPKHNKWASWLKSLRPQPSGNFAISFMNYLDEHRPDGKMCLSNGECADIETAFKKEDWAKVIRYVNKYQPHWKPSENKDVYEIAYERYPINNRLVREVTKDINEDTRDGFIDGYNYCNSTHWKPSKKQMEALKVVARGFLADDPDAIDSLLTDLQKLL